MSVNDHGDAAGSTARARRPRGRPRGRRNLLWTEQQFLEAILRVAAMKLGGGRTLYDANVDRLSRGDEARLASRSFLEIIHMARKRLDFLKNLPRQPRQIRYISESSLPDVVRRGTNGRFARGSSGNPLGRPRRSLATAGDQRGTLLDAANMMEILQTSGGPISVTRFEARLIELGSPQVRNRLACKQFIEEILAAAQTEDYEQRVEYRVRVEPPRYTLSNEEWDAREERFAGSGALIEFGPAIKDLSDEELLATWEETDRAKRRGTRKARDKA